MAAPAANQSQTTASITAAASATASTSATETVTTTDAERTARVPEIAVCLNADGVDDKHVKKMPDRIMLIHSELPLHLAVFVDNPENEYLFQ